MNITAQLDQLTTADKIRAMESLWDDLCRHADEVRSPEWHRDMLLQREKSISEHGEKFNDWELEKTRIRSAIK